MAGSEAKADTTIVRPGGFTPSLSAMDIPRPNVAAKKRKRRIMIVSAVVLGVVRNGELLRADSPGADAVELGDQLLYIKSADSEH